MSLHTRALTAHLPPPASLVDAGGSLTTSEVADVLGCHPRTVTRLIRRGHLPAVRLGPGRTAYRVASSALLAFVLRYGHHEPHEVADASNPDALPEPHPEPVVLHTRRTPDGLLLVTPTP